MMLRTPEKCKSSCAVVVSDNNDDHLSSNDMQIDDGHLSRKSSVRHNIYASLPDSDLSSGNGDDALQWHASVEHNGRSKTKIKKLKPVSATITTHNSFAPLAPDSGPVHSVLHSDLDGTSTNAQTTVPPTMRRNIDNARKLPPITIVNTDDMNAKVGKRKQQDQLEGIVGPYGLEVCNDRGERLVQFSIENDLGLVNTMFMKHSRRLSTWTLPNGHYKNQIDYILISRCWRCCIRDATTKPGAECGSDHKMLKARFKLKLRTHQIITKTVKRIREKAEKFLYS